MTEDASRSAMFESFQRMLSTHEYEAPSPLFPLEEGIDVVRSICHVPHLSLLMRRWIDAATEILRAPPPKADGDWAAQAFDLFRKIAATPCECPLEGTGQDIPKAAWDLVNRRAGR